MNIFFQIFELKRRDNLVLNVIHESKLNNRITCCALTSDGNVLALGLDSGDVAVSSNESILLSIYKSIAGHQFREIRLEEESRFCNFK